MKNNSMYVQLLVIIYVSLFGLIYSFGSGELRFLCSKISVIVVKLFLLARTFLFFCSQLAIIFVNDYRFLNIKYFADSNKMF